MRAFLYRYPHPTDPERFLYVGQETKEGRRDKHHRSGKSSFGRKFKRDFPDVDLPQPVREEYDAIDQAHLNIMETCWMFQYKTWHKDGGYNLTLPGSQDYKNSAALGGRVAFVTKAGAHGRSQDQRLADCKKGGQIQGPIQGRKNVESGHAQALGTKYGCISGRKSVENGRLAALRKKNAESGALQAAGRKAVESGRLARLRTPEHQRNAGIAAGKKSVESGQIQALGLEWGRKAVESGQLARLRTPEHQRAAGLKAAQIPGHMTSINKMANCVRWNVRRGKPCICGRHEQEELRRAQP